MRAITRHLRQVVAPVLALCAGVLVLPGCEPRKPAAPKVEGGTVARGKALLAQYQCGSCHSIPGVEAARGALGPPLAAYGLRSYVAGRWPNEPAVLVRWIRAPHELAPGTLMPDMGVSDEDARHMAAYLYSLQ